MPAISPAEYPPLRDYALIGDGHTAALISRGGSIDWFCVPRFDSPAVFCRLLDASKGGSFRVAPAEEHRAARSYLGHTNVLATTFTTGEGEFRLTDFMPVPAAGSGTEHRPRILRLIEGMRGNCRIEISFAPIFDYARANAEITICQGGVVARATNQCLTLASPGIFRTAADGAAVGRLFLGPGDRHWIALTCDADANPAAFDPAEAEADLDHTLRHWEKWAGACTYEGPYHDLVRRSALTLKLLIHEPTGALIAAPTTSLPEVIGGAGNWDYRYTWLRDAGLILDALELAGYHDEAARYFDWLEELCLCCTGGLRIMYAVDGSPQLPEQTLDHLEGYRGSQPVRIGNAAATQQQLDVYGHVIDAVFVCHDRLPRPIQPELWEMLRGFAEEIAALWREPDQGPWEVRGEPRHFLYSKLFCWVGLDRALRIAQKRGESGEHIGRWREAREQVRAAILTWGYDEELGAFTYVFGEPVLDASALAIPLVDFLPATDPRMRSTAAKIHEQLSANGLVYRNFTLDLRGEGTFTLCSFWLVENLALQGRLDQARELFERIAGHASDLGLFSEEIDANSGELLGNYPQGYTHLGLIRAAARIAAADQTAKSAGIPES